jgi:signal transduction histidine kinase
VAQRADLLEPREDTTTIAVRPRRRRSTAAEGELRRWLARELHDSVARVLTGLVIDVERVKLEQAGRRSVLLELDSIQASTREVLTNLRQTMQMLRGEALRAPIIADWLGEMLSRFQQETGIETRLDGQRSWPSSLNTHAAINICRIVEEALQNVRLHSRATSVTILLACDGVVARLLVSDDGRGLAPMPDGAGRGLGTLGMTERAALLGGQMTIEGRPGNGTSVELTLPVERLT